MKLFTTKNIEIVKYSQEYFGFALPSVLWPNVCLNLNRASSVFCLLCNCVVLIIFVLFILLPCLLGE